VKVEILQFLLRNLSPPQTIAHFLLGYRQRGPSAEFDIDTANAGCLQTILKLTDSPTFAQHSPLLAELCFELIYHLAADKYFGGSTMRFLRHSTQDFFSKQLQMLPAALYPTNVLHQLNQRAWFFKVFIFLSLFQVFLFFCCSLTDCLFLKLLALEIHISSSFDYKEKILLMLFDTPQEPQEGHFFPIFFALFFADLLEKKNK
jgi:hypothetical protein